MKYFKSFFKPQIDIPTASCLTSEDHAKLDHGLDLLRSATAEVSQAAMKTAKVLEDKLHDTEIRFFSTIDMVDDLVIIKDGKGRWKTLNKTGQVLFNWIHREYINKTDKELQEQYPLYAPCLENCIESDEAAWREGRSHRTEEYIPYAEGYRCFDVIKTPVFDSEGNRKELIVVGRDITEIIEKRQRTKACFTAINSASDIIAILDWQGLIFFCNDQFVEAFKKESYKEFVGQEFSSVMQDFPDLYKMWEAVQRNQIWHGMYHNFTLTAIPVMNGEIDPVFYIITLKKLPKQ